MLNNWSVTYEIVTEASATNGDYAESGFLDRNGATVQAIIAAATPGVDMSFREAVTLFNDERDWTYLESDCDERYPHVPGNAPKWITDYGETAFTSGETRAIALHIPPQVTQSSRYRLLRMLRAL